MTAGPDEVVAATSNPGKLREIRAILADLPLRVRGLDEFAPLVFPEEGDDYAANAVAKASRAAAALGRAALADDSGLEVDGLGGGPGPRSARYGGPGLDDAGRSARLLEAMAGLGGRARQARFVCVAALAAPGAPVRTARGECPGRILRQARGRAGFGYDPVFEVAGRGVSMAELPEAEKNRISHRARALRALFGGPRPAGDRPGTGGAAERRIVLIRHAESTWNADGLWQGQADPPLSGRGRRQARALARALAGEAIQVLVTSDLRRAAETAAVVGRGLGLTPIPDPSFRELDVGEWSGLTRAEIEGRDAERLARFQAGDPEAPAGGGESRRQVRERVQRAAAALLVAHRDRNLALVTHLGVIRALLPGAELPTGAFRCVPAAELATS